MLGICCHACPVRLLKAIFASAALSAVLFCGNGVAAVQGYPEIEYAAPDPSIWTTRVDAHGETQNPLFVLAGQMFSRAGIPWRLRSYPAARMFRYLEDGTAQFSILVASSALTRCCLVSKKPVAVAEIRVFHRAGLPILSERAALAGKSVITVRGYSYGELKAFIADPANRVIDSEAPDHVAAFRMLANGRGDYLLDYSGPAAEILARDPVAGLHEEVLSRQPVYLVLARSYPNASQVMARFEEIVDILRRERAPALRQGR
jgi:polar amino acid transport system substrate-binding protein